MPSDGQAESSNAIGAHVTRHFTFGWRAAARAARCGLGSSAATVAAIAFASTVAASAPALAEPDPPPPAGSKAAEPGKEPTKDGARCPPWVCKPDAPKSSAGQGNPPPPPAPAPAVAPEPEPAPPPTVTAPPAPAPAPTPETAPTAPEASPSTAAPTTPSAPPPSAAPPAPAPTPPTAGDGPKVADRAPRKDREQRRFIEGELANVGATGLTPWQNRFGLVIGPELLGPTYYAVIRPEFNYTRELRDKEISLSFQVPVRLQIIDTRPRDDRFEGIGSIRKQDWDEPGDFARIISYISYGGKEERLYLDINQFKASSIGHGTVIKRYNPNLNFNSRRVSFEFDAFGDYGGFETYLNDITGPSVMGALAFVKPLSLINRNNYFLRSFSLGATIAADIDAPLRNRLDGDDADDDGKRTQELSINQKTFQPNYIRTEVVSYGTSVEAKLVDTDAVDWKTYLDHSFLESGVPTDDPNNPLWSNVPTRAVRSGGTSWGHLLRLNLDRQGPKLEARHALRMRLELRSFDPNYLPSYFDTLYEVQRVQYVAGKTANTIDLANRTKLQSVLGRDASAPAVKGIFFETSWKAADWFAIALAVEMNDSTPDNNWFIHFEVPNFYGIQFLATYHRRTARDFSELFSAGFGNNDVIIVKGRYRLGEAIAFNAEAFTPFGIGPDSLFRNVLQFNVNAEIGFNYGKKKR